MNINSVNPLYLGITHANGYIEEKGMDKYLVVDSTKECERVWSEIRSEIKRINGGKKVFFEKKYRKILKMIYP